MKTTTKPKRSDPSSPRPIQKFDLKTWLISLGIILGVIGVIVGSISLYMYSLPDVKLSIGLSYSGSVLSDEHTEYVHIDTLKASIVNSGRGTAKAEKISIYISGTNIELKDIPYTGDDLGPKERHIQSISITLINESQAFTLTVHVSYNGNNQDSSSL